MNPRIVFALLAVTSLLAVGIAASRHAPAVAGPDVDVATPAASAEISSSAEPLLRVAVDHEGEAADFLLRVEDEAGLPVVLMVWSVSPGENVRDFSFPEGKYVVTLNHLLIMGMTSVDLAKCPTSAGVAEFDTRVSGLSFGIKVGQRCLEAAEL